MSCQDVSCCYIEWQGKDIKRDNCQDKFCQFRLVLVLSCYMKSAVSYLEAGHVLSEHSCFYAAQDKYETDRTCPVVFFFVLIGCLYAAINPL